MLQVSHRNPWKETLRSERNQLFVISNELSLYKKTTHWKIPMDGFISYYRLATQVFTRSAVP